MATEIGAAAAVAQAMLEKGAASGGQVELTKPANWDSMSQRAKKYSLCKSQALSKTPFQRLSAQKPIRSQNFRLLKRISASNHYFRSCVITLRSMIRARCVLLRPGIHAENLARESGSTRLV
jgi:hypothetical protein